MSHTFISVTIGVAIALWCAWYCRHLAVEKGRNVLLWTLLGLVLTVVVVPVLVVLPRPAGGQTAGADDGVAGADDGVADADDGVEAAAPAGSGGSPAGDAGDE